MNNVRGTLTHHARAPIWMSVLAVLRIQSCNIERLLARRTRGSASDCGGAGAERRQGAARGARQEGRRLRGAAGHRAPGLPAARSAPSLLLARPSAPGSWYRLDVSDIPWLPGSARLAPHDCSAPQCTCKQHWSRNLILSHLSPLDAAGWQTYWGHARCQASRSASVIGCPDWRYLPERNLAGPARQPRCRMSGVEDFG